MKNVLRRVIELLNLLSENNNLSTENIKDSISDYSFKSTSFQAII